jgi:hypothetical protein
LGYAPGELLVKFAPKPDDKQLTTAERNTLLAEIGCGTIKYSCKLLPGLTLVKLPENLSVENALPVFKNSSGILYAKPNYRARAIETFPNDPRFNELWGMHNTGQTGGTPNADVNAPEAWDIRTGSGDIIVAVIDSGVDYNHPDLTDNMWTDANGSYGYNYVNDDNDPMDDAGHGTHCAGIIGAVGNNAEGVTGVCWNTRIMALKWLDSTGFGDVGDAIMCIDYAVQMGAKVLSNSWRWPEDDTDLEDAIEAAGDAGVLFVASAGNKNLDNDVYDHYPSNYALDNIIAVMATDHDDNRSWESSEIGSNWGANSVDLAAPGSDILSCWPTSLVGPNYRTKSGTSASAAYVSGAAALIWSRNKDLGHLHVKDIILNTVDELDSLEDYPCVSGGRLNLYNAITTVPALTLSKVDNVSGSVCPSDEIIFTISYVNPVNDVCSLSYLGTVNDVNIIDYLPEEVDFNSASGPNSVYDSNTHTVTWQIGTLSPGEENFVTLTVNVNQLAEPLGIFTNFCKIQTGNLYTNATADTNVCCWSPDIIYVDANATDSNTGMSWKNAYIDLQDALDIARTCGCNQIRVADGIYYTHTDTHSSYDDVNFALVDGVPIYGGFAGYGEPNSDDRDVDLYESIFEGDIDNDDISDTYYLVKATNVGRSTILDGFTITNGLDAGIKIDNASPTIRNNKITENGSNSQYSYGSIECINGSSPLIENCLIQKSNVHGIYTDDSDINISHCFIRNNKDDGICADAYNGEVINIKNNWICDNGTDGSDNGIFLRASDYADLNVVILNNTISNNSDYGIITNGYPQIIANCIIWDNADGELAATDYKNVIYCCIKGGYTGNPDGSCHDIIDSDPCFVDDVNGDYHLLYDSNCIDAGDSNSVDPNETDIDGEPRFNSSYNPRVDIGADEAFPPCWSCPTQCHGDSDCDGDVDTDDFLFGFKPSFGTTYCGDWNDGAGPYNPCADYDRDGDIDTDDFLIFKPNFGDSNLPSDCGCCGSDPNCSWPPDCSAGRGGGEKGQSYREAEYELFLDELVKWLEELLADDQLREAVGEDEWQKFIETIADFIETLAE